MASNTHTSEDVSTEPQLAELNRMSLQLKANLESMIEEQRARVEAFTANQHSLSSLPAMPQLQQPVAPQIQSATPYRSKAHPSGFATSAPAQPSRANQPPPLATRQQPTYSDAPPLPKRPAPKPAPVKKKEENGCGWIIAVVVFLVALFLRNCG